jgi:hypothetical protein
MSLSNSILQQSLEDPIIEKIKLFLNTEELSRQTIVESTCTFKFDFYNLNESILGEIYSCGFPLKEGHKRKIKSDILKLLTYEKLKPNQNFNKYIVLTASQANVKSKDISVVPGEIIRHGSDMNSFIGSKSWLATSIEQFNIQILYFVLDEEQSNRLNIARNNQKQGMITKK